MPNTPDPTWIRTRVQHAVQALAVPADIQCGLFPPGVCAADELALDFDHWYTTLRHSARALLTAQQTALLRALDERLAAMSGATRAELWSEEALHAAPEWAAIRELAQATLVVFGWTVTPPPSYGHEFIPGRSPS